MVAASRTGLAVLEVPEAAHRPEALAARRLQMGEDAYDEIYSSLSRQYYRRDWFREVLSPHFACVDIVDQELDGYFTALHRFNVFAYKAADFESPA